MKLLKTLTKEGLKSNADPTFDVIEGCRYYGGELPGELLLMSLILKGVVTTVVAASQFLRTGLAGTLHCCQQEAEEVLGFHCVWQPGQPPPTQTHLDAPNSRPSTTSSLLVGFPPSCACHCLHLLFDTLPAFLAQESNIKLPLCCCCWISGARVGGVHPFLHQHKPRDIGSGFWVFFL